ncbi:S8 family serine peptidase [Couchioplanes caeruleus]|uniref:Serine protease n=2 Tax=Couchioplanes caeruleus TaxID=56438 RepID=A0A1K0GV02_9ACTN|nr:S8 family serine peptidase [Couchioplanes caeruleus]OJF13227.1 serine protease [Couchioplanes caeruleus subsp. caeruleus]ROP27793.1 subtilase family protein [Couchioplanes caeruleus]
MTKRRIVGASALAALTLLSTTVSGSAQAAPTAPTEYTVVAEEGVPVSAATAAITAAGGTVVARNDAIGLFRVTSHRADFPAKVAGSGTLIGANLRAPIGRSPRAPRQEAGVQSVTAGSGFTASAAMSPAAAALPARAGSTAGLDPLDTRLWGLKMIKADRARSVEAGERGITVGMLDTGLDASNPDLAANFSASLSRNFAPDIPEDGPCEVASCLDPVGTDDGGHGTHVAGTIAAAADGFGISGVAPGVTLVELKGGQDSGSFFLEPIVNALTYAGDAGLDVVNMSFYVDPWLYNCTANAADSPAEQAGQQAIIAGMRRALEYAHSKGVTLVGALGNNHEDLGSPRTDTSSPNFGGTPRPRRIDNATCWDLPVEGPHVIGVSSVGPSTSKADYSNYGVEQISVAAPGGFRGDGYGTSSFNSVSNQILSTYPLKVLREENKVDSAGNVRSSYASSVFKRCTTGGACGYYTYLQGTSMAAPHASGVAALIASRYGTRDATRGGMSMDPAALERRLYETATKRSCPSPRLRTYTREGRSAEYNAYCSGDSSFNGFYGYGIVDAYASVTR